MVKTWKITISHIFTSGHGLSKQSSLNNFNKRLKNNKIAFLS